MLIFLSVLCVILLTLNALLIIKLRKVVKRPKTYDCTDLIRDLLVNGTGLVKIDRVATEDVFLRARR